MEDGDKIRANPELIPTLPFGRGLEIKMFMESVLWNPNSHTKGWSGDRAIIIDDDSFDVDYWREKDGVLVVKTNCHEGITSANMREMIEFEKQEEEKRNA